MSRIQVVKRSLAPRAVPCLASSPTRTRATVDPSRVDSDWFDRMWQESWELHRRIAHERCRLRERVGKVEDGETITRIDLERKLPREVWTLLLWYGDGEESYESFRETLLAERTVVLRKCVERHRDETFVWAEVLGRGGRDLGLLDAHELLCEEDRAVLGWTLLLAGVGPEEAGQLTEAHLPPM